MAETTSVNSQITDSITQVNTKVLGESPAMALSNLFIATGQALSNSAHNATSLQMNTNVTSQAAMSQGVVKLHAIDTAVTAKGTKAIYGTPVFQ